MADKVYDLEERLLNYAVAIIGLAENLRSTPAASHIGGQLLRAGTSPYLNHGEAEAAESRNDFLHKIRVCLKELRESRRARRLIRRVPLTSNPSDVDPVLQETEELIRIFVASVRTASRNAVREESGRYAADEADHSAFDVGRSTFGVSPEGA